MATDDYAAYQTQILAERDLSQPLYLLVDPLRPMDEGYSISLPFMRENLGEDCVTHVPRPDLSHTPGDCPHLALLADYDEVIDDDSVQRKIFDYAVKHARQAYPGGRRYICGLLQSDLALDALAENLAQHMMFHVLGKEHESPGKENTRIYPLHEPLRQELMASASNEITPDTYNSWLWPISLWVLPTSNQGFIFLKGEKNAQNTPPLDRRLVNIQIDAPSVEDVISVVYEHHRDADDQFRQAAPLLRTGRYPLLPGIAYQAYKYLHITNAIGIKSHQDQVSFAVMRLIVHPKFDQHPKIQALIHASLQGKGSYTDLLATIDMPLWMQIVHDLKTSRYLLSNDQ